MGGLGTPGGGKEKKREEKRRSFNSKFQTVIAVASSSESRMVLVHMPKKGIVKKAVIMISKELAPPS